MKRAKWRNYITRFPESLLINLINSPTDKTIRKLIRKVADAR